MKQFSLEEYLKNPSRKVVTRDGRNVRIICTDMRCADYPIIALVEKCNSTEESPYQYRKNGYCGGASSANNDLFFSPKKHEGWVNLYKILDKDCSYYMGSIFNSKAEAENKIDTSDKYVATIKFEWEE